MGKGGEVKGGEGVKLEKCARTRAACFAEQTVNSRHRQQQFDIRFTSILPGVIVLRGGMVRALIALGG